MVSVFNVKTMQKPRIKTIYFTAENYNYILSLQEKYKYLTFNKAVNEIISKQKESEMSDGQIEKEFTKEGIIPMQIAFENGCDCEMVYLVPIHQLDKFEVLSR